MPNLALPDLRRIALARRAWEMWTEGAKTQKQIAAELGVHQGTVSRWLKAFEARFLAECIAGVERVKARQTAQLEHMAREAMRGFDRSRRPTRRTKTKTEADVVGTLPSGEGKLSSEDVEVTTAGNPRWLECAAARLAEIRRIWGIERPPEGRDEDRRTLAEIADEVDAAAGSYRPEQPPDGTSAP